MLGKIRDESDCERAYRGHVSNGTPLFELFKTIGRKGLESAKEVKEEWEKGVLRLENRANW
jgi:hypothetical protein